MGTEPQRQLWIGAIGLPAKLARAIAADLPAYRVRRLPPSLRGEGGRPVRGSRPALVIVDATAADAHAEREAAWRRWGPHLSVVEVNRTMPIARVWLSPGQVEVVELGPGFLVPYLPLPLMPEGPGARPSGRATTFIDRIWWWRRRTSFLVRLATYVTVIAVLGVWDRRLDVVILCSVAVVLPLAMLLRRRGRLPSRWQL